MVTVGSGCFHLLNISFSQCISDDTKKTYAKYQQVLGDNTPTIEDFAKIRYNEDDWKAFKAYTSSIKTGELTPFANFKLYQNISKEMDEKIIGIVTSNGIKITGKSNHSIARVIGSVNRKEVVFLLMIYWMHLPMQMLKYYQ